MFFVYITCRIEIKFYLLTYLINISQKGYVRTYLCQVSDTGSPEPLVSLPFNATFLYASFMACHVPVEYK
jgi:hypothetical protein